MSVGNYCFAELTARQPVGGAQRKVKRFEFGTVVMVCVFYLNQGVNNGGKSRENWLTNLSPLIGACVPMGDQQPIRHLIGRRTG